MSKEKDRAELHRAIWKTANDLRSSVDGWDFKQYALGCRQNDLRSSIDAIVADLEGQK